MNKPNQPAVSLPSVLRGGGGLLLAATLFAATPARAESFDGLARELARLRAEVEELSDAVRDKRDDQRHRLSSLANRRALLESDLQRERMRVQQLSDAMARHRERVALDSQAQEEIAPEILSSCEQVRTWIRKGIPFASMSRVKQVDDIESDLRASNITPALAASRLWSVVEDELRMTRESGLYQQVITLDGEEMLTDVVRLGLVALYFRTTDNRYGTAQSIDGTWTYVVEEDPEAAEQLAALFAAMQKRIRTGLFELPLHLSSIQDDAAKGNTQ